MGVAPGVRISNMAVFDDGGWVAGMTTSKAMARVVADGARVANMSYAPVKAGDFALAETLQGISAHRKNALAAVAAGNSGMRLGNEYWSRQANPLGNLVIVGSVDADKVRSPFSNIPGEGCFTTNGSCAEAAKFKHRFLMAPGGYWINSTAAGGGYVKMAGTSMAAPHVAGAAALLMSRWKFLTPVQTARILFESAEDLGQPGVDPVYGRGLLRVDRAFGPIGQQTVATGTKVQDGSVPAQSTRLVLPAALGTGRSVRNAMSGAVVFDDFGRDFEVDAREWTVNRSGAVGFARHLARATALAEAGTAFSMPVSLPLPGTFSMTGVIPPFPRPEPGAIRRFTVDPTQADETGAPAWRIDGDLANMQVSIGQGFAFAAVLDGPSSGLFSQSTPTPLFLTESHGADQPLLGFAEGGSFGLGRVAITDGVDVSFGFTETSIEDVAAGLEGDGRAFVAQASFRPAAGIDLRFTQTFLDETDMMLGGLSSGALSLGSGARTFATGVSATIEPVPALRLQLHLTEAVTSPGKASDSLFRSVDDLRSRSYGASLTRIGIFGARDELGLNVTRPLRIHDAGAILDTPVGRTDAGDVVYRRNAVDLEPGGHQTDIELGYRATVSDGVGFGLNLFHQDQLDHDPGLSNTGFHAHLKLTL
ncbi:MAG TPA: S8 family serine peptidase, partial [Arenibaculum sp.]|nr:S8 family serine peptidase [Arenibaculum sp.]